MGHGHHHSCHSKDSCHSSHNHGRCCSSSCSCSCHHGEDESHHECDYAAAFLELADEAWMEVLKEKIKDIIRSDDKKINELAAIVAQANNERWKKKMAKHDCCAEYEKKLHDCLNSCCSDSKCSTKK